MHIRASLTFEVGAAVLVRVDLSYDHGMECARTNSQSIVDTVSSADHGFRRYSRVSE